MQIVKKCCQHKEGDEIEKMGKERNGNYLWWVRKVKEAHFEKEAFEWDLKKKKN